MIEILVPLAPAELLDLLTQLQLRTMGAATIDDGTGIARQLHHLQRAADRALPTDDTMQSLRHALYEVNQDLETIEADIRSFDRLGTYGTAFTALVRSYHACRDERQRIKAEITAHLQTTS